MGLFKSTENVWVCELNENGDATFTLDILKDEAEFFMAVLYKKYMNIFYFSLSRNKF